jgi:AraC-like DNA-binding protein
MLHGGTPADCIYECFLFDLHGLFRNQELVKKYLRPIYRMQLLPKIRYTEADAPEILAVIRDLLLPYQQQNQPETTDLHELITYSCLSRLFTAILRDGYYTASEADSLPQSRKTDQVKSVLEYIETNFSGPLSLEKLAAVVGMNPKYFCRVFSRLTHQSPMDYVNFYRIEQAAYLLSSTALSVTAVAMECGFWESSYFTKVFKKYKGTTPKRHRAAARAEH